MEFGGAALACIPSDREKPPVLLTRAGADRLGSKARDPYSCQWALGSVSTWGPGTHKACLAVRWDLGHAAICLTAP